MDDSVVRDIKERTDCRLLIGLDLGKPKTGGSGSKAWAWKCPMHHEVKGFSLTAWYESWKCWGACGVGGDAIKWLQHYHGMSFVEACQALGAPDKQIGGTTSRRFYSETQHSMPAAAAPPDEDWQLLARRVIEKAKVCLWADEGAKALAYLKSSKRGLWTETIRQAGLGYVPGDSVHGYIHYHLPDGRRFDVPCGIVIPWILYGQVWGIKVRRAGGDLKYIQVVGSRISGQALYGADELAVSWPALFVEGEFDCLIAWQEGRDLVCPVTLGAASNQLHPHWYTALSGCTPVLTAYDVDPAGDQGAARLAALTDRARRVQVPSGKDVSEFHSQAGPRAVYEWLEKELHKERITL